MLREEESLQMVLLGAEKPDAGPTVQHRCSLLLATTAVHRDGPSWPDLQGDTDRTEKHCTKSY